MRSNQTTDEPEELEPLRQSVALLINNVMEPTNATKSTYTVGMVNKNTGKSYQAKLVITEATDPQGNKQDIVGTTDSEAESYTSPAPTGAKKLDEIILEIAKKAASIPRGKTISADTTFMDEKAKLTTLLQSARINELNKANSWALTHSLNDASKHKWYDYYNSRSAQLPKEGQP